MFKNLTTMEGENKELTREGLLDLYSDYLLSHENRPLNVHQFAKENGFEESAFYKFFGGFTAIESEYLKYFFDKSLDLTQQMEGYSEMNSKDRLLNLYYLFFENLNMNRSLVLTLLKGNPAEKLRRLAKLRQAHKDFVNSLDIQTIDFFDKLPEQLKNLRHKGSSELFWMHFVSILKVWEKDESAGFEKTDLYIEKSMDTGFSIVESPIINKVLDFGKFLWHEKF